MKREDYYIQEALKYAESETLNTEALAFIAGMKMADSYPDWKRFKDVAPTPLDGEDFLVKVKGIEEDYAYAWYAYDRQCFICYATGLSLPSVTNWMPIVLPIKEDEE
jgi:hypothetical protein